MFVILSCGVYLPFVCMTLVCKCYLILVYVCPHVGWGGADNICWDPQYGGISLKAGLYITTVAVK